MGWGYTIRGEIGSSVQWVAGCCVASMIMLPTDTFLHASLQTLSESINDSSCLCQCVERWFALLHVTCYMLRFHFPTSLSIFSNAICL